MSNSFTFTPLLNFKQQFFPDTSINWKGVYKLANISIPLVAMCLWFSRLTNLSFLALTGCPNILCAVG